MFLALVLMLSVCARAGIDVEPGADDPFPTAGNKVLVVDFQSATGDRSGADVGALFARSLLARLSVDLPGGLGVVRLVVPPGQRVDYTQIDEWAAEYQADVVVWGEVYPAGTDTWVVTRLSLKGILDDGSLDADSTADGQSHAAARLQSDSLSFPAIPLASDDLAGLGRAGSEARTIYAEPYTGSPVVGQLPQGEAFSLGLVPNAPPGWHRVYFRDVPTGWVRTEAPRSSPLHDLPVIHVAEALFQLRAGRHDKVHDRLAPLLDGPRLDSVPQTRAAIHVLAGVSALRDGDTPASARAARDLFVRAGEVYPVSRDVPNFRFASELALHRRGEPMDLRAAERRLVTAIAGGGNVETVHNLGVLYGLPEAVDGLAGGDLDKLG